MSLILELKEAVSDLDYGHSELETAVNGLPDYDGVELVLTHENIHKGVHEFSNANESSKDHLHQAESYILNAREALENVITELEDIAEKFDR